MYSISRGEVINYYIVKLIIKCTCRTQKPPGCGFNTLMICRRIYLPRPRNRPYHPHIRPNLPITGSIIRKGHIYSIYSPPPAYLFLLIQNTNMTRRGRIACLTLAGGRTKPLSNPCGVRTNVSAWSLPGFY